MKIEQENTSDNEISRMRLSRKICRKGIALAFMRKLPLQLLF